MAAILMFICLLADKPLLPHSRENTIISRLRTRGNLKANKRTLKWQPFWNKVYGDIPVSPQFQAKI